MIALLGIRGCFAFGMMLMPLLPACAISETDPEGDPNGTDGKSDGIGNYPKGSVTIQLGDVRTFCHKALRSGLCEDPDATEAPGEMNIENGVLSVDPGVAIVFGTEDVRVRAPGTQALVFRARSGSLSAEMRFRLSYRPVTTAPGGADWIEISPHDFGSGIPETAMWDYMTFDPISGVAGARWGNQTGYWSYQTATVGCVGHYRALPPAKVLDASNLDALEYRLEAVPARTLSGDYKVKTYDADVLVSQDFNYTCI